MLFPYNTDAPIYHLPIVTIGLIVVNVAVYVAQYTGLIPADQVTEYWMLSYGDGLHPMQWLLANFMHDGLIALLINLVFLWSFGLVTEGKLGWWKFLLVFLVIAVGESAIEQTLLLGSTPRPGRAVGASSVIYGLLAICLIWAPRNDLSCMLWLTTLPKQVEIPILTFGGLFIGAQVAMLVLIDAFSINEAALQLIGATLGAVIGVVLLKTNVVDCEGWDLFSVVAGRDTATPVYDQRQADKKARDEEFHRQNKAKRLDTGGKETGGKQGAPKPPTEPSPMAQQAAGQIDLYLQQGNAAAAATLFKKLGGAEAGIVLEEKQLVAIIQGLLKAERWSDAVPMMVAYLKQFPDRSARMRIKLAEVLIHHLRRPETARRVLDKLPATGLPEPLQATKRTLLEAAAQLEDDADLEVDKNEDW